MANTQKPQDHARANRTRIWVLVIGQFPPICTKGFYGASHAVIRGSVRVDPGGGLGLVAGHDLGNQGNQTGEALPIDALDHLGWGVGSEVDELSERGCHAQRLTNGPSVDPELHRLAASHFPAFWISYPNFAVARNR